MDALVPRAQDAQERPASKRTGCFFLDADQHGLAAVGGGRFWAVNRKTDKAKSEEHRG